MSRYIPISRVAGQASRQAHADLPAGSYEREISKDGFYGPASFMYHRHPPTGWSDVQGPLRPHAFDLNKLQAAGQGPWDAAGIVGNSQLRMRFWRMQGPMYHLVRNADGDELMFVHEGSGHLFCDYGHLAFERGDYLLLPRGTMWRVACTEPLAALMIEVRQGSFGLPEKGLLGAHALFDPAMLDTPQIDAAFRAQQEENTAWTVRVKRGGQISVITYPYNPLDVLGWHGELAVVRLNLRDIRPVTSHRYHLPPSVHTTFMAPGFVVCTFVPRPFETDPGALKVPFFHNNDDYDEVIFYHAGEFFSRDNIKPGMMTLHPGGITHGPHPQALKHMLTQSKPATDEFAVMLDAREPLRILDGARAVEWSGYVDSWKTGTP
ncbi:MAG: homogentisate 1,2-dioxygenase [Steroidobacteraceae bacterium]